MLMYSPADSVSCRPAVNFGYGEFAEHYEELIGEPLGTTYETPMADKRLHRLWRRERGVQIVAESRVDRLVRLFGRR